MALHTDLKHTWKRLFRLINEQLALQGVCPSGASPHPIPMALPWTQMFRPQWDLHLGSVQL